MLRRTFIGAVLAVPVAIGLPAVAAKVGRDVTHYVPRLEEFPTVDSANAQDLGLFVQPEHLMPIAIANLARAKAEMEVSRQHPDTLWFFRPLLSPDWTLNIEYDLSLRAHNLVFIQERDGRELVTNVIVSDRSVTNGRFDAYALKDQVRASFLNSKPRDTSGVLRPR